MTSRVNPWLVAIVVSLATFMEVLDTTITNVSLRNIAGSLGAGQDESTWVLTSYLVANGIILPLSGWLSDVLGRKRFFIGCILGFTLASFFCGAATSLAGLVCNQRNKPSLLTVFHRKSVAPSSLLLASP